MHANTNTSFSGELEKYPRTTLEVYIKTRTAPNDVINIIRTPNGFVLSENDDVKIVMYVTIAKSIDTAVVPSSDTKYTPTSDPATNPERSVRIAVVGFSSASSKTNCLLSRNKSLYEEDIKFTVK